MGKAAAPFLCSCGAFHAAGLICDQKASRQKKTRQPKQHPQAQAQREASLHEAVNHVCTHGHEHGHDDHHAHHEGHSCTHEHGTHSEAHAHEHHHAHSEGQCCSHEHIDAVPLDMATLEEASPTRALYRIANMDCPMEEALIRKRLADIPGITDLNFNLMQRVLTVEHSLSSLEHIESALHSIGMIPEPLAPQGMVTSDFSISGMDCPAEESLIRARLKGISGISGLKCNLIKRTLHIQHTKTALPAIADALESLNMGAVLLQAASADTAKFTAPAIPWRRLAFAAFFAFIAELAELLAAWGANPIRSVTIYGIAASEILVPFFAVAAILLGGLSTYRKGWLAVKNGNLNINALMSVAVTGAVLIGQYPEAAMVMVLFNIAEAIEAKSLDRARKAIKQLLELAPERATVQRQDGSWEDVDIRTIAVGSHIRVKPGERIALDGVLHEGHSTVNQASITGESMPVEKSIGDCVFAGTVNESGSFVFRVTAGATDTTLARIISAVEEAQSSRAPTQRFVDQFAKYYTPAVFLVALLTALIPPLLLGGIWQQWIYTGLVVLVIGCPCALVISTPVSIVSGMAAATKSGILVKGGAFLEMGRQITYLALDKTGTLTQGKPVLTNKLAAGSLADDISFSLAASLASRSDHPVSLAIAEAGIKNAVILHKVEDFQAVPGQGVRGKIEGKLWHLGNHRMLEELGKCSPVAEEILFSLEKQGKSVVILIGEDGPAMFLEVADSIRENSAEAIRNLKELGVKTVMLTGDNEHAAKFVADAVNVDGFEGGLLPEDKLRIVEKLSETGICGMVGDGINDAPALARADIGFAMAAAGTDTAIETADVALMDDDLRKIPRFIRLSRATHAILVQNITLALGVKALFLALTFMGQATMWMAVFADVGTSLLVVGNGLRAMKK